MSDKYIRTYRDVYNYEQTKTDRTFRVYQQKDLQSRTGFGV